MKKENPGGFSFFIGTELRIRVKRGKVKRRHKKIFAGAVYHSDTVASRLRRVNRICSSRVGENCVEVEKWAHTVRPCGRKNLLPFSFSKRSPVSGLRQSRNKGSGIHKGGNLGVHPCAPAGSVPSGQRNL